MKPKKPRAARPGRFTYRDGVLVHAADGRQVSDAEFIALAEEWARRPGRHTAQSLHDAAIARALIDRHGVKPKKRAILAVAGAARFAVVERAYQKLVRSGRFSYVSDRHHQLRAALDSLKKK